MNKTFYALFLKFKSELPENAIQKWNDDLKTELGKEDLKIIYKQNF